MPQRKRVRKVRKDKKQDNRIRSLENFVYKTIENKQQNFHQQELAILDVASYYRPNLLIETGAEDGGTRGIAGTDEARIGNSITLMNQRLNFEVRTTAGQRQTMRLIVAESVDGAENLTFDDILEYWKSSSGTATGTERATYTSHYTTKSAINKRYKIHMDKVFSFEEGQKRVFRPKLRIKYGTKNNPGKVVDYVGGQLENQPVNHKLTIMAVSDQTSSGSLQPQMSYSIRSTYKDA